VIADADRDLLAEYERRRAAAPLRFATLWDRPAPRTSQRRYVGELLAALGAGATSAVLLGGNRSGKSEAGAILDVAHALGGDHPDVVRLCERNGLPVDAIPPGPGRVWVSAPTFGDARKYVRPKIEAYCPKGTEFWQWSGNQEGEARLPGGGVIVSKAVDQGRRAYQGDAIRWARWDEEPEDLAVVREARMRLADCRGRELYTMSPILGWTELLRGWLHLDDPIASVPVRALHGRDNPHVPTDYLEGLLIGYDEAEAAARARGEIRSRAGLIFPRWDRGLHVVEPTPVPGEWVRYAGLDFGARNPTAYVYAALDADRDVLHIVDGIYGPEILTSDLARRVRELEAEHGRPSEIRWADSEGLQQRIDLADLGIETMPAIKAVRPGINAVGERLRASVDGRPGLVVHRRPGLEPLIRELEGYVWAPTGDAPLKRNDHAVDALRYLVLGLARYR
jgi:phage terminase large subunit-like protein